MLILGAETRVLVPYCSPETRVQSYPQKTLGLSENQPDCGDRLVLEYSTQAVPNGLLSVNTGTIVNNIMTLLVVFTQDNPLLHLTTIPKIEAKPLQAPHYRRCTRNFLTFANIAAIAYGQKLAGASIYFGSTQEQSCFANVRGLRVRYRYRGVQVKCACR